MALTPGTKLGPYEILAPLGAGGMGEVYRARDTRLGREVAVKVLPAPSLIEQPEVRARFEREASTVSSLNHPHICTLYDVGREGEHRLPGDGAGRGRDAGDAPGQGRAAGRRGAAHRRADRRRARPRAPRGRGAPRPQARQRHAHEERRQADGLRPRARNRAGGPRQRQRRHDGGAHAVAHRWPRR